MTIETEFRRRIAEVIAYLSALERLEGQNSIIGQGFYRAAETIAASRASAFIMIYNCVEYAVRECVVGIRSDIRAQNAFHGLRPYWREEIVRAKFQERLSQGTNHIVVLREMASFPPDDLFAEAELQRLPFSGSIDNSELFRLIEKIESKWTPPRTCLGGGDLVVVRKMRNDLAHGAETFEAVGSQFSTEDMISKARRIRTFIASAVHSLERYRARQLYNVA